MKLIETDLFPIEFLSRIAERESWRKEIHRPIYHVHKWWATRLGSVFRGILLGSALPPDADLTIAFYTNHDLDSIVVWDPFMGSGTTVGEAHKLGMIALGRDINPIAEQAVRVALGPISLADLDAEFSKLDASVGRELRQLYRSVDSRGCEADVLYWFWVMRTVCPGCGQPVELMSSPIIARNAYPDRKPQVQVVCTNCAQVFESENSRERAKCSHCYSEVELHTGPARGAKAVCGNCSHTFSILQSLGGQRPQYRLIAKLLLRDDGTKEYLAATERDLDSYAASERELARLESGGVLPLPRLQLAPGFNTKQAMRYGFAAWRDFFNSRQLLALGKLREAIAGLNPSSSRDALETLFSGALEFNNMFASYKGEGTGAVRHMFAHHILKPERVPIEANVWGTSKSSGSFTTLYRSRLLRALGYRMQPKEVRVDASKRSDTAPKVMKPIIREWTSKPSELSPQSISISCGDSANSGLASASVDLIVTDPPFFDNVHYSELADFFYAWRQPVEQSPKSTRHDAEVQDASADAFSVKLGQVFLECSRVLKKEGILVFTYHHSREDGWQAVGQAILRSGFAVANAHPIKAEMSVATPKSQAKEPIQVDIILVCKAGATRARLTPEQAVDAGFAKAERLRSAGLRLSVNDIRAILFGQLLCTIRDARDIMSLGGAVDRAMLARSARELEPVG